MDKIDYKLVRSKRRKRTISFSIDSDGMLVVRAPYFITNKEIEKEINRHRRWIDRAIKHTIAKKEYKIKIEDNGRLLFMGREIYIKLIDGDTIPYLDGNILHIGRGISNAYTKLVKWYRNTARDIITNRVVYYAKRYGFDYSRIRITSAKTRWGSCGKNNSLNFTWRLVMAPIDIIDYVVVHELAHIPHKNHSSKFWELVGRIIPDYRQKKKWLKDNSFLLDI